MKIIKKGVVIPSSPPKGLVGYCNICGAEFESCGTSEEKEEMGEIKIWGRKPNKYIGWRISCPNCPGKIYFPIKIIYFTLKNSVIVDITK